MEIKHHVLLVLLAGSCAQTAQGAWVMYEEEPVFDVLVAANRQLGAMIERMHHAEAAFDQQWRQSSSVERSTFTLVYDKEKEAITITLQDVALVDANKALHIEGNLVKIKLADGYLMINVKNAGENSSFVQVQRTQATETSASSVSNGVSIPGTLILSPESVMSEYDITTKTLTVTLKNTKVEKKTFQVLVNVRASQPVEAKKEAAAAAATPAAKE
ncbi:MAG TPA: hypothetical protein VLG71_01945 [Candidatus Limnocylindria bacterium]|nr:hypothetical protein [Candidatus Limnocylindria bacterium]